MNTARELPEGDVMLFCSHCQRQTQHSATFTDTPKDYPLYECVVCDGGRVKQKETVARKPPYNEKIQLHMYHHDRTGSLKLHRTLNRTQGWTSELGGGYTPEQAEQIASALNCKVEVIAYSDPKNANQYIPTERQDELEMENLKASVSEGKLL